MLSGKLGHYPRTNLRCSQHPAAPENLLYFRAVHRNPDGTFMDAFWSIFGMPIGVTLCFGPAMVVWWLTKDSEAKPDDKNDH